MVQTSKTSGNTSRALLAGVAYLNLLAQDGASAYGLFHRWLLRDVFNILKKATKEMVEAGNAKKKQNRNQDAQNTKKRKATSPPRLTRRAKRGGQLGESLDEDLDELAEQRPSVRFSAAFMRRGVAHAVSARRQSWFCGLLKTLLPPSPLSH